MHHQKRVSLLRAFSLVVLIAVFPVFRSNADTGPLLTADHLSADFGKVQKGTQKQFPIRLIAQADLGDVNGIVSPATRFFVTGCQTFSMLKGGSHICNIVMNPSTQLGQVNGALTVTYHSKVGAVILPTVFTLKIPISAEVFDPPDLIPQIVSPTAEPPAAGANKSTVKFQLKVLNTGGPSVACEAQVLLDDILETTVTVPSVNNSFTQNVEFKTAKSGQHKLKVIVDSNGQNSELNENNNTTQPVTVNIP